MTLHTELYFIAAITACACTLPGIFLVIRGTALMSDALSHAVLFGIAAFFFITGSITSPFLLAGAALSGLGAILITEKVILSKKILQDAAIGIIYPLFFSLGSLLISYGASNTHLDFDMVFLGELAFAPLDRLILAGHDIGPTAWWTMLCIFIIQSLCCVLFYKEIITTLFDQQHAQLAGYNPSRITTCAMLAVSITAVGAFSSIGSIMTMALMIVPPATALLFAHQPNSIIFTSLSISIASALVGCYIALLTDISIAGTICTVNGCAFLAVLIITDYAK